MTDDKEEKEGEDEAKEIDKLSYTKHQPWQIY